MRICFLGYSLLRCASSFLFPSVLFCLSQLVLVHSIEGKSIGDSNTISPRIINGEDAQISEFPWMAALVRKNEAVPADGQFGGATLIHPWWVLTAAHTVDTKSLDDLAIVFGTEDLRDTGRAIYRYPRAIIRHPGYVDLFNLDYDVALILLSEPVLDIPPLHLISDLELESPGTPVRSVGWGRSNTDMLYPERPDVLQSTELEILSHDFLNQSEYYAGRVTDWMIGTGSFSSLTGTFHGDSGGPTIVWNSAQGHWEQVGVISWGASCRYEEIPWGVDARIWVLKDWIVDVIQSDIHDWYIRHDVDPGTYSGDGDPWPLATEYVLGLDPDRKDFPDWSGAIRPPIEDPDIIRSYQIDLRDMPSSENLTWEVSPDMRDWTRRPLEASDIWLESDRGEELNRFGVPLRVSQFDQGRLEFVRLTYHPQEAVTHGPFPLRVGDFFEGVFTASSSSTGASIYNFEILDVAPDSQVKLMFHWNEPITNSRVEMSLYHGASGELLERWVSGVTADFDFSSREGQDTYLLRIKPENPDREANFTLETNYLWNSQTLQSGGSLNGQLTQSDSRFKREGHLADAYQVYASGLHQVVVEAPSFDSLFWLIDPVDGEVGVDIGTPGETERYLFSGSAGAPHEIIVSSFKSGETGRYTISVEPFVERTSISVGESFPGILIHSDRHFSSEGEVVYVDEIQLVTQGTLGLLAVEVEGVNDYIPSFGVIDETLGDFVDYTYSACAETSVIEFTPNSNREYTLVILGLAEQLGSNYQFTFDRASEINADDTVHPRTLKGMLSNHKRDPSTTVPFRIAKSAIPAAGG